MGNWGNDDIASKLIPSLFFQLCPSFLFVWLIGLNEGEIMKLYIKDNNQIHYGN